MCEVENFYRTGPTVYLAGPMVGHTVKEALHWRLDLKKKLQDAGMGYAFPYDATDWFVYPDDKVLTAEELANMPNIWKHDKRIVETVNVVLVDFRYAKRVSIGTVQEIAWAVAADVPVVLLFKPLVKNFNAIRSWHDHPFLLEQATAIFEDEDEAVEFLHHTFVPKEMDSEDEEPGDDSPGPLVLYTDGSCLGNPGPGGWAVVRPLSTGEQAYQCGGAKATSNNRMEIQAVIEALRWSGTDTYEIHTDSRYVINCATGKWGRKANVDLWLTYDQISQDKTVTFVWVKGHNGNPHNNFADKLAKERANAYRNRC